MPLRVLRDCIVLTFPSLIKPGQQQKVSVSVLHRPLQPAWDALVACGVTVEGEPPRPGM
jgi:hypothetical protein